MESQLFDITDIDSKLIENFQIKYMTFLRFGSANHNWSVVGRHGAVHLHFSRMNSDLINHACEEDRWTGGVEYHWRVPPDYMDDKPPSHANCDLLNSNCWHDGSSTYARESYLSHAMAARHEYIFISLINDYREKIETKN